VGEGSAGDLTGVAGVTERAGTGGSGAAAPGATGGDDSPMLPSCFGNGVVQFVRFKSA
jgi:hypothetical protein